MATKKTFKENLNPALQFISLPKEQPEPAQEKTEQAAVVPEGYKLNPLYVEKRSKRVQLLLQPSLHQKIKDKAEAAGKSVNDIIHSILEEALKGE